MEILLNVLWFSIAAGSLVAYIWLTPLDRKDWQQGFVAMVCLCVLLLPVISITDDLNSESFTVEDFNLSKKLLNDAVHPLVTAIVVWAIATRIVISLAVLRWRSWQKIEEITEFWPDPACVRLILARAPPNVL